MSIGIAVTRRLDASAKVLAIRHGETAWSLNGRHTGTTDIPLTDEGRHLAEQMWPKLSKLAFALVLVSPMQRARETCELAGLGNAVIDSDLMEWNYGAYEGLTPTQIREISPGWLIFRDGCPGGEDPGASRRADRSSDRSGARNQRQCGALRARLPVGMPRSSLNTIAGSGAVRGDGRSLSPTI
jgi:broad specificity phosphatase PhoE